ncbi:peptidylprolyl isomerase fpr4 [Haplosporangium sp. Z 767]|nr:peptidylprolyl isomerase fpr4 [Haplosporangium sp. Z 767]
MILGFWGLTVFPNKTYTQIVDNSFKLTMAALDEETTPGRTSIRVAVDKKMFILCSLISGQIEQQALDLVFTEGEEITFSVSGDNAVHLSGNYLPEEDTMEYSDEEDMYGDMDEEDSDEDSDMEENMIITKGTKRLADFIDDEAEDEDSEEDPDFTGEDEDDEDDEDEDEDEDEENGVEGQGEEDSDEDEDDDDEEEEEGEEGEEEEEEDDDDDEKAEPVPVKKPAAAAPAAKKQKITEDEAVPIKAQEQPKKKEEPKKNEEPKKDNKKTLPNGLVIEDTKPGEGARAKAGKKIGMRYVGRLTNGKVFDKNTSGKPFHFNLGRGEVIKGWDLGIQGMQLGGERRLTIPPALAYGAQGAPPDIPRNATLVFDVKLVTLK